MAHKLNTGDAFPSIRLDLVDGAEVATGAIQAEVKALTKYGYLRTLGRGGTGRIYYRRRPADFWALIVATCDELGERP